MKPVTKEGNILVVDDDETLLKFFKIHFHKFYTNVFIAKSAKEALELLKTESIDLVITDIRMPRSNGFQFVKKLRNFDSSIPVMMISGEYLSSDENITNAHVDGFLPKPFQIEELENVIDLGLARRAKLAKLKTILKDNGSLKALINSDYDIGSVKNKEKRKRAEGIVIEISQLAKAS